MQEEALKAGYGPTIRADAVKKLVDSVVNYQERSREIIDEMRTLSTKNATRSATRSRTASGGWRGWPQGSAELLTAQG